MNVFILCTGRCGSVTFIKACQHITNFTSMHESRSGLLGNDHFNYPTNHIEADNRLSWFLGSLDKHYGNNAVYVHLKRDREAVAISVSKRLHPSLIMSAYRRGIIMGLPDRVSNMSVALDYVNTVNNNIESFLKDKTKKMEFSMENKKEDFRKFWECVDAEGDMNAALLEFDICYNAASTLKLPMRMLKKLGRLVVEFLNFIKRV